MSLIRTWLDLRSREEIKNVRDMFLGLLPGFLAQEGRHLLFYEGLTDIDRRFGPIEADLRRIRAYPILPEVALHRASDRWSVAMMSLALDRRIRLLSKNLPAGIDMTVILKGNLKKRYTMSAFLKNTISLLALRRLLRKVRIDEVYMPFENNCWQKLLTRTARETAPAVRIKAFQHAQIARNSSRLFLGDGELRDLPLPERIFTFGSYPRNFLVNEKGYPPDRTVTACPLRQDQLSKSNGARPQHRRLLACLWTMRRSVDVVQFLSRAELKEQRWEVRIRPHPVQPIERVQARLGRPLPEGFEISTAPFTEDLHDSEVVLYNGTTACLDALAISFPVINLEFDDFISPDPLFELDAFTWTVRTGEELSRALKAISELSDEEVVNRRDAAQAFVDGSFIRVSEACIRKIAAFSEDCASQSSPKTSSSNSGSCTLRRETSCTMWLTWTSISFMRRMGSISSRIDWRSYASRTNMAAN